MTKKEYWEEVIQKQCEKNSTQRRLLDRDGSKCRYCGVDGGRDLQIDHVYPKFRGGSDDDSNLGLSCQKCNRSKSYKVSEEWGNVKAFKCKN